MLRSMIDRLAAQQTALVAEAERALRRWSSVPNVVQSALAKRSGCTAYDVVLELGSVKLLRYRRTTPATQRVPVLCCYALVNRPYILDLLPDKSVIRQYLARGFDVYIVDWGVPSDSDRALGLNATSVSF